MNCNILAQKRQMGNKPILLHHSSVKRLTVVLLVCLVVCPHMTSAQPPDTSSLNGTTLSEFINVGPGQTVNKDISDFTNFYSHSQTVGVWVDGGLFTDDTGKADQKQIQIFSPAIFQVGGKRLYDADPPQNTAEDSLGGRIRFNSLITSNSPDIDPSVHPDVSIILLGSSGSDSSFSAGWVSLSPSPNNEVRLYIDGFNSSCKTSFEVDKYLQLNGDADRLNGGKLSFILKNSGSLSVGGDVDMAFTSPGDRFVVRNDSPLGGEKKTQKISVGGRFFLYNSATRPEDLSAESDEAIVKNTDIRIGERFGLIGGVNFAVGDTTFLQVINDPGVTATITASDVLVYSNQSGNTTSLLLGHGAKVNAEHYVYVLSQNSSKAQLLLGDSLSKWIFLKLM